MDSAPGSSRPASQSQGSPSPPASSGAPSQGGPAGTGVRAGLALPLEGLRLLRRRPALWPLAAMPALLALAFFSLCTSLLIAYAEPLYLELTGWVPVLEAGAWYTWIWIGPGKFVLWIAGFLLFAAVAAISFVLAFLLANVLAAPFLDVLSQRVEVIESGGTAGDEGGGVAALLWDALGAVRAELLRVGFFLLVWAGVSGVALVVPGAQLLAPPAMMAFTILFLPLDYCGYALDRRRVSFKERRHWIRTHLSTMAGFGSVAFVLLLVPGLNLLLGPALVTAGTLLALRRPPETAAHW